MSTRYTKAQKAQIESFRSVTGASEKIAIDCLKASSWGQDAAVDYFYTSGLSATAGAAVTSNAMDTLFNKYKDSDGDTITGEGIMQLCKDLGVEPADPVMLVVAYHMGAATMGEFTKEEFRQGLLKVNCDTVDKLKRKLPELRAELKNADRFKDIYQFAYPWSCEKGQKCVHFETAVGMWQLLLGTVRPWVLVEDWIAFLKKHHNRAISKDTWDLLLDFIKTYKPDLSDFDGENSAWPYLFDEFVDYQTKSKA